MIYHNALIFTTEHGFLPGGFAVEEGRFTEVFEGHRPGDVDLGGLKVIPGLVDIHIHGAAGADFSDGDCEGLTRMARTLARRGITSFLPTSMTLPYESLTAAFDTAAALRKESPAGCARPLGIHMEGPYFSEKKKGAQNGAYLKTPDIEGFEKLQADCGGFIRLVDMAPELEGAEAFTRRASQSATVSVAHTDADYNQARAVYEAGATHLTHLYNAMPGLMHRSPGPIGAASEREDVFAELICDGYHIHPSAVRAAFKLFPGRICLISDALRCCGMPEGRYDLGGQPIELKAGVARLLDGTIAGAASDLLTDMKNAMAFGIPEQEAVLAATLNPARSIGAEHEAGAIRPGLPADFLVLDEAWELKEVYIKGQRITP